ncbi:MAG: PQQ-binding-like beta-propeller repeat protein [Desulfobaccales bacterium]
MTQRLRPWSLLSCLLLTTMISGIIPGSSLFGSFIGLRDALADGTLKWSYRTGSYVSTSPAIDKDGTIYVSSWDHYLYAFYPNGTLKWKYSTGDIIRSSPAISDGTIYVGSCNGYFYAMNPNGTLKWRFVYHPSNFESSFFFSPAIGPHSLPSQAIILVGVKASTSTDHCLIAIRPNGTLKWRYMTPWPAGVEGLAIGYDRTVYVGVSGGQDMGTLYALNLDNGSLKWKYSAGPGYVSAPAVGAKGTVYIGSYDKHLYALNPKNGSLQWKYLSGGSVGFPVVGADGTIYVGSGDGYLYALNPNGTLKWRYRGFGSSISNPPNIGKDGTVYFGDAGGTVYALNGSSGGRAKSWSMFHHNSMHTAMPVPRM